MKSIFLLTLFFTPLHCPLLEELYEQNFLENIKDEYQERMKQVFGETENISHDRFNDYLRTLIKDVHTQAEFETFHEDDMHNFLTVAIALKRGVPHVSCQEPEEASAIFKIVIKNSYSNGYKEIARRSLTSCDPH